MVRNWCIRFITTFYDKLILSTTVGQKPTVCPGDEKQRTGVNCAKSSAVEHFDEEDSRAIL